MAGLPNELTGHGDDHGGDDHGGDETQHPVSNPAWLIASGGSTGSPKLIGSAAATEMAPTGAGVASKGRLLVDADEHRHPVHLVTSPLYHTQGFALLHHTLIEDYRNVVLSHFDVEHVLDLIETERVNFVAFVPTMLIRLLRSPTIGSRDLSSLERVAQGGGACPDWVIREWIRLLGPDRFLMGYGSSESVCSTQIEGNEWLGHPGSVGRPVATEVVVVDDQGETLLPGEVGELFFRPAGGEAQVRYVGGEEPRRRAGGFVSIGDLGWLDEDGYMYIADRRTDMIVSGGANVYVSEVESVFVMHPDVEDAVVIGIRDTEWGRRVHAVVQLRAGATRDGLDESLRAHCKGLLAAYKVPKTIEVVGDLDRSDSGKINRRALAEERDPTELARPPKQTERNSSGGSNRMPTEASVEERLKRVEERLKRLEDLQEIHQVLIDYGEFLDMRDLDSFAQLWAEEAEFEMSTGRVAEGRQAIREMLADVLAKSPQAAMHIETNARIDLQGDQATSTIMYAAAFTQDDGLARVTMLGHHYSDLVRTDEGWKISRRHNVVDLPETGHP